MRMRGLVMSSCAWLALAAAACAAPGSQPPAAALETDANADARAPAAGTSGPQDADPAQDAAAAAPERDLAQLRQRKVRTGGPLPPRVLPGPDTPDRSCRSDADCADNDDGNCCGSSPDCGIRGTSDCHCVDGSCIAQPAATLPATPGQTAPPHGPR